METGEQSPSNNTPVSSMKRAFRNIKFINSLRNDVSVAHSSNVDEIKFDAKCQHSLEQICTVRRRESRTIYSKIRNLGTIRRRSIRVKRYGNVLGKIV